MFVEYTMSLAQPHPINTEPDNEDLPLNQSHLLKLLGYNCRLACLRIFSLFMERMAEYELRPVEYTILTMVNANPDTNQKRLAQAINVSPPNLAPLLDKLEKRGLLMRKRNPTDKRSQTLALTPEGMQLCQKADKTAAELEYEATNMLTDEERTKLLHLLQKIFLNETAWVA